MVSYFEKAKLKMLTFKRLIHRERKSSSNPMNLWDLPSDLCQAKHGEGVISQVSVRTWARILP